MTLFLKGASGPDIATLQQLLSTRGYPAGSSGTFDALTYRAVRAFQSQNMDQHGAPLVVDGRVGDLTWWSLNHPKPLITQPSAIDFTSMPAASKGGSAIGRSALSAAIGELKAGAGEVGGDNRGPWVKKYLAPAGVPEGNAWCAGFVSWCFLQASGGALANMPFTYDTGARSLLKQLDERNCTHAPASNYIPLPGDLATWWRVQLAGWQGHVGIVHEVQDGMLYTIEGNRSPNVQGFSYVVSRMDELLGYEHVPDSHAE